MSEINRAPGCNFLNGEDDDQRGSKSKYNHPDKKDFVSPCSVLDFEMTSRTIKGPWDNITVDYESHGKEIVLVQPVLSSLELLPGIN